MTEDALAVARLAVCVAGAATLVGAVACAYACCLHRRLDRLRRPLLDAALTSA